MKFISLSKTVRALGSIAVLSILVGASVQQTVQAQAQDRVPTGWELSCSNWTAVDGTFLEFEGVELTPEQEAAYQRFVAEADAKNGAIWSTVRAIPGPDLPAALISSVDTERPSPEMEAEILAAYDAITLDQIPDREQVEAFNQQYGQYGELVVQQQLSDPTPEQNAEMDANLREVEAQILSILTPEQQQAYQENLIIKRALEDCDPVRREWMERL